MKLRDFSLDNLRVGSASGLKTQVGVYVFQLPCLVTRLVAALTAHADICPRELLFGLPQGSGDQDTQQENYICRTAALQSHLHHLSRSLRLPEAIFRFLSSAKRWVFGTRQPNVGIRRISYERPNDFPV